MKTSINQAFCEVYDIINHMSKEMQEKIPKSFVNLIKDNRDLDFKFYIDYSIDIKEQLLEETKVILSLIYRDYLCDKEKREKLLAIDLEEIRREETILQEKYKIDFENRKKDIQEENLPIKVEKGKWYIKIIDFIKKILKR